MTAPRPLAIDLDGTLLRSDMLLESWWNVLSHDAMLAIRALAKLPKGKAGFKQILAENAKIDVAALPYNPDVLDLVRNHREAGGTTALVTASDQHVANAIAEHLGCFDEVHASDGALNLKGENKAAFLVDHFGERGFDYAGDDPADLEVWKHAERAITVNASPDLRAKAAATASEALHIGTPNADGPSKAWIRAMRPHQWAKNVLVFLPMLMGQQLDPASWAAATFAFVAFSLIASSVYLLNDLLDLSADRIHPRKRHRALPSGEMKLVHGSLLSPALLLGGLLISVLFLPAQFVFVLLGYFLLTTAYSLVLKRELIIDICTLAALYGIRIVAGASATEVAYSPWLLAFSSFLFLSLAAIKRQAELVSDGAAGREGAAGRAYLTSDLPIVAGMGLTSGYLAVLVMALYVNTPIVSTLYRSPIWLWFICPILLFWISRTVMISHRGEMHDDPVVYALKDSTSRICGILILIVAIIAKFY